MRQYFNRADAVETEIRRRATHLWEGVEWDWFLKEPGGKSLDRHWSPDFGWKKNMKIVGWNEGMIDYLLAIASPTHPIPAECYYQGWAGLKNYAPDKEYYGFKQAVGRPMGVRCFSLTIPSSDLIPEASATASATISKTIATPP